MTEQLRQSHQLLDAVFDSTDVLIAVLDPEMNFIRVNRAYAAADGRTPDYFPGRNHFALYPHAENETIFRRAVQTGEPVSFSARPFEYARHPDRGVTHWDWTLTPVRDGAGTVTRLVLALLNVSERIQAMEALGRRERELEILNDTLEQRVRERAAELAAAHGFTETVLETLPALVVVLDREGRIVRFNRACERTSGYRANEALGRCVWDFLVPPEECGAVRAVFDDLIAGRRPRQHENDWLTRDGGRRRIMWSNSCVTAATGEVQYVVGTGIDVTERRTAESALRTSEETFRQLAEHIQETFFVRDLASNRMVYVSPSYEAIWGRPCAALYADPADFLKSVHPDDLPRVIEERNRQYGGQGYFNMEYRVVRPDGGVRWVWARTFPIPDEHGKVYRVAGLVQDLTGRKQAEEALAASERQFRQLAENIQEVFWLVSPDRRTLYYVSPAFERVWGRSCAELHADPQMFLNTIHPEDRATVLAQIESQLSGEFRHHYDHEFRIVRPDGEVRWIHSRYSPIRDGHGGVQRIAGISEDITGRKLAERERLAEAAQQREALVREVHHRIKNNLQGVVGLLRRQAQKHPGLGESMEGAIAQVSAMAVVHGLQGQSRDMRLLLCDLARAVCRSVASLTGAPVEPQVWRAALRPVPIARDEAVAVALILNELVMNAVKHSRPEHAEPVEVTIDRDGNEVVLRVMNRGDSLPAGLDLQRGSGLGTGLSLVRSLLPREAAGLTLAVENSRIVAELRLSPPLVIFPVDADTDLAPETCLP